MRIKLTKTNGVNFDAVIIPVNVLGEEKEITVPIVLCPKRLGQECGMLCYRCLTDEQEQVVIDYYNGSIISTALLITFRENREKFFEEFGTQFTYMFERKFIHSLGLPFVKSKSVWAIIIELLKSVDKKSMVAFSYKYVSKNYFGFSAKPEKRVKRVSVSVAANKVEKPQVKKSNKRGGKRVGAGRPCSEKVVKMVESEVSFFLSSLRNNIKNGKDSCSIYMACVHKGTYKVLNDLGINFEVTKWATKLFAPEKNSKAWQELFKVPQSDVYELNVLKEIFLNGTDKEKSILKRLIKNHEKEIERKREKLDEEIARLIAERNSL